MRIKFFLVAVGVLGILVSGCVPRVPLNYLLYVDYKETGHSWVGQPISRVVKKWGKPSHIIDSADGSKDYQWYWSDTYKPAGSEDQRSSDAPLVLRCSSIMRVNSAGKVEKFLPDNFDNNCDHMPPLALAPGYVLRAPLSK